MKNVIKIVLFLAYTISIFLIKHELFPIIVLGVNFILTMLLKVSIKEEIGNILGIIVFILFTTAMNVMFVNVKSGIMIGVKLILVCNITFIFSKVVNYMELADGIEKIFSIFKVLKINPKNISIMICICITFIPTIKRQIKQVINSLKAKGIRINVKNMGLIFEPVMIALLKRVDEIEDSLKAKAYENLQS